jgi:hypothetical protein
MNIDITVVILAVHITGYSKLRKLVVTQYHSMFYFHKIQIAGH